MRSLLLGFIVIASGCATEGMSIPIGAQRTLSATNPDEVLILIEPPGQAHEIVALVEGSRRLTTTLANGERRTLQ
jgi:hypothetical protein